MSTRLVAPLRKIPACLRQTAYDSIKQRFLDGTDPPGRPVSENQLAITEHGTIIEALISDNGDRASELMRQHLRSDRELALKCAMSDRQTPTGPQG